MSGTFYAHQLRNTSLGTCCHQWTSSPATEVSHKAYLRNSNKSSLPPFVCLIEADDSLQQIHQG